MRGEYFVVAGQHEHAEELLKQVLASDEAKADGSFEGGWDNFTLIRANHQYGICLRQRHENRTALAHFEIALKLLEQRMNQMGIFKNRYMLVERFRILKSLRELYIEFEDHEKAENAQVAILQMQKTLDRIPQ